MNGKYKQILRQLAAFCLLLAATLVVFWPLVRQPGGLLVGPQRGGNNDLTAYFLNRRAFPAQMLLQDGQLPLWNPYLMGGAPWLGNPQAGLFYPPNWLLLALPAEAACSWFMVLHHLLAGTGVFLLCRRYALAWLPSLAAGICLLATPYYVMKTAEGHFSSVCLFAWIPWAFLACERLRRGRPGAVGATAAVLALGFFCGHVQELFYLVLILTGWLAADMVGGWRESGRARQRGAARNRLSLPSLPSLRPRPAGGGEDLPRSTARPIIAVRTATSGKRCAVSGCYRCCWA